MAITQSTKAVPVWLSIPVRFVLAGGAAATVNFLSRIALSAILPYALAIVTAYALGMLTAFLLNRRFVFLAPTRRLHHQVFWFVTVNMFALLQTLVISLALADVVLPRLGISRYAETIAHAIGIAIPIFTSYLGHRRLTFR